MGTPANFAWVPSSARVVSLDGFGLVPRGTSTASTLPLLAWPAKDPTDRLDYILDISEAVVGNESDAIATLDVQFSPNNAGDLILVSASATGCQAILWFTGGTSGTNYAVTITVGTNSGRILGRTVTLPVLPLTSPPVGSTDITDQTGAPITDQNNQPITTS